MGWGSLGAADILAFELRNIWSAIFVVVVVIL